MHDGMPVGALILATGFLLSTNAFAADISDRAGKVDASILFDYVGSESIGGRAGSSAEIDNSTGFGINVAYNVNNSWAFGLEFISRDADYTAHVAPDAGNPSGPLDRSGTLETSTTNFTGTYYFSPSSLSLFVTANIGQTWVDTNIPSGPPTAVCWWDPWWGYYCGPTVPTKTDSYFGYGAGVGVRWEANGPFFVRALVNEQWLDVGGAVGTPSFTQYRVDLGARF